MTDVWVAGAGMTRIGRRTERLQDLMAEASHAALHAAGIEGPDAIVVATMNPEEFLGDGNFAPFDFPDSISTQAWDMNPSGEVVGIYADTAAKAHGFLLSHGEFVSIDYPGAKATRAFGINPQGDVVGSYVDAAGKTHAFLLGGLRGNR